MCIGFEHEHNFNRISICSRLVHHPVLASLETEIAVGLLDVVGHHSVTISIVSFLCCGLALFHVHSSYSIRMRLHKIYLLLDSWQIFSLCTVFRMQKRFPVACSCSTNFGVLIVICMKCTAMFTCVRSHRVDTSRIGSRW